MEDIERARTRLNNVRTVEPILGALRTISLGSWQLAQSQRGRVASYRQRLAGMLLFLRPHLPQPAPDASRAAHTTLLLAVGSERGLCGRFNTTILEHTRNYLTSGQGGADRIELNVMGTRLARFFRRAGYAPAWTGALSMTSLPPLQTAVDVTRRWLARYEDYALDAVDVVYNVYRGMGQYTPTVARLVPPQMPPIDPEALERPWPPPDIETDPAGLYMRILEQWTVLQLYEYLLESAAAEQSARYQLMESATQNAQSLTEELTLVIQSARRQAITREMIELAVGAGLIGSSPS